MTRITSGNGDCRFVEVDSRVAACLSEAGLIYPCDNCLDQYDEPVYHTDTDTVDNANGVDVLMAVLKATADLVMDWLE